MDDFFTNILWLKKFLHHQGIGFSRNVLMKDNQSEILLERKGRSAARKCSRTIDIQYFTIRDSVEKEDLKIKYCPTDDMVLDFLKKPLQGSKSRKFRKLIIGM